jgi:alkyl hydroperoxide reductase subunit AhpC
MLSVRSSFPQFRLTACVNRNEKFAFQTISAGDFPGKWIVYFFWPKDFKPVCATELYEFGQLVQEFSERDAVLVGGSVDSEFVHLAWSRQGEGPDQLPFPLLSDIRRDLASALGILDSQEGVSQRATFVVDPSNIIRFASVNDFSVGRNPNEVLRVLDALQTDALCPSNWTRGSAVIASPVALFEQPSQANAGWQQIGGHIREK